jgi:membrane protease subunit HflK
MLTAARGRAAELIYEAEAYRWQRSQSERGKAERFVSELAAYRNSPALYRTQRYLDVLVEGLSENRKVIVGSNRSGIPGVYRIDLKDSTDVVNSFIKSQ